MPTAAEKHVAGVDVLASGSQLDAKIRDTMLEVRVRDTLLLPSSATIRVADPKGDNIDKLFDTLGIGKDIEVKTFTIVEARDMIKDLKSVLTVVDGEIVYSDGTVATATQ